MCKENGSDGARDFSSFIETLEPPNTKKVVKSLSKLGEYDYSNITPVKLESIILSLKPNSPKAITTICYVLGLYAKYLNDDDFYYMVHDIDRNAIWILAKPNAPKKFISNSKFKQVYKDIELYEEYNSFYISTLFRCLYEGIYSDDMSVIKNLRASDIKENIVTLRPDNGEVYDLAVSDKLASDLIKLGGIDVWERRNRYGTAKIKITGLHKDTCFKVENRKGSDAYSYRFTYYRILRKIAKEYLEFNLLPLQIYVSGIMYRIEIKLEKFDIKLEEAFATGNRNKVVNMIISNELTRCNCNTEVRNFREIVNGHLDVFSKKYEQC